jgi:hypothetical protein
MFIATVNAMDVVTGDVITHSTRGDVRYVVAALVGVATIDITRAAKRESLNSDDGKWSVKENR